MEKLCAFNVAQVHERSGGVSMARGWGFGRLGGAGLKIENCCAWVVL